MVSLSPPTYALSAQCPVKWTATQEKTISTDFAHLDLTDETPQDYVLRNYLQFLWLPQYGYKTADLQIGCSKRGRFIDHIQHIAFMD